MKSNVSHHHTTHPDSLHPHHIQQSQHPTPATNHLVVPNPPVSHPTPPTPQTNPPHHTPSHSGHASTPGQST